MLQKKPTQTCMGLAEKPRADQQERRLEAMHVGFTEFLEKCEPAHLISSRPPRRAHGEHAEHAIDAHRDTIQASPDFEFQPSPVGQDEPTEPARSTNCRTREHDAIRDTRTRDHDAIRDMRNPRSRTTSGTRAPGITTTSGTAHPRAQRH